MLELKQFEKNTSISNIEKLHKTMKMRDISTIAIHISNFWAQNRDLYFGLFISKNLNQAGELFIFVMSF